MPKKRKDGRYQRKITLSDGRQKIVYGRTLAELNDAADEMRSEDRQGMVVGDTTTVGEWAKIWITKYKGSLRPKTLEMYRGAYNVHILPVLGDMMLRSVRPVHCREVMHRISDQSESLQHKVIITMHQIFSTAQQNGLVLTDPSMGLKVTPHHRGEKRKSLSDEQVKELTIHTSATYLSEALLEQNLMEGHEDTYGLYIDAMDGEVASASENKAWCFDKNGEMVETGVAQTILEDGSVYNFYIVTW